MSMTLKICPNCNTNNKIETVNCINCGTELTNMNVAFIDDNGQISFPAQQNQPQPIQKKEAGLGKQAISAFFRACLVLFIIGICISFFKDSDQKKKNKQDDTISFTYEDCKVDFIDYKIEEKYGDKILYIYMNFKNNTDENQAYYYNFTTKAFQKGVELDDYYDIYDPSFGNSLKDVKPLSNVKICEIYYLNDDSDVTIEIYPWSFYDDDVIDSMEINVKGK